jgi:DNA-binding transcriptional LysR family regulator
MLGHVDEIMARFHAAQADVAAALDSEQGELHLGFFPGLVPRLLPALMERLGGVSTELRLTPHEAADDQELFAKLESGAMDVAFVELPIELGPFEHHELRSDPWVLLVQADSPLARSADAPELQELARLPLIAPSSSRSHARVEALLEAHGLAPRVALRTASEVTVQALVGAGAGVGIVPRLSVVEHDPRVAAIELDQLPPRSLALCWLRNRQELPGLHELCRLADDLVADLVPERYGGRAAYPDRGWTPVPLHHRLAAHAA